MAVDNTKNDLSLSVRLRKQNYENYINEGEYEYSPQVDAKSILDDLENYSGAQNTVSSDEEMSNFELVSNAFKSTMVGVNEAQLSATRGVLRREVLPNIDKAKFNINLFSQYDDLNERKNTLLNRLATTQDEEEANFINNELINVDNELTRIKENLASIGVSSNMENAEEIRVKQEADLAKYQEEANKLYEDINTDEQDLAYWKVDERFQRKMDENNEFEWTSPSKWIYQIPSVIGSSSSSAAWQVAPYASTIVKNVLKNQLIKTGARVATSAAAGSVVPGAGTTAGATVGALTGAVSTVLDLANAGMLIYSNYKQAADEANANVSDEYSSRIEGILNQKNITKSDIVNQAKSQGLSEEFSKLSDDDIFEKILDGQIQLQNADLNNAVSAARSGIDALYTQNMAITFGANLLEDKLFLPYFGKISDGWVNKTLTAGSVLANPIGAAEEAAVNATKKKLTKYILGRNAIDNQTKTALRRARKAAYFGTDLLLRNAVNSLNEAVEEGSQYTSGKAYSRGELDDDDMDLKGIANSIFSAYKEKGRTLANILGSPFGYQDALYNNDTEYWQNVKLGAAASLLSPFSVMSNVKGIHSNYKELKGMDVVNQLASNEINTKEEMEKAISYAGGKLKGSEADVVNAWLQLANGPEENLPEGLTREDAKKEAEFAAKVFRLSEDDDMKRVAEDLNIETNTQEFGELIGLYMQAEKEYRANVQDNNEKTANLNAVINQISSDEVLSTALNNSVNQLFESLNESASDPKDVISKEEIREASKNIRELDIVNKMLDEVNKAVSTMDSTVEESIFLGNQYTSARLEDLRARLNARRKTLERNINKQLKTKDESKVDTIRQNVRSMSVFDNYQSYEAALEDKILSDLNVERNQEIINSFLGTGRTPLTRTERQQGKEIKEDTKQKSKKKLKLKALRNIHDNMGFDLIYEMYHLYKDKRNESRELSESIIPEQTEQPTTVAPATRTVPAGTTEVTVTPSATETVTPEVTPEPTAAEQTQTRPQPRKPLSRPTTEVRNNIAQQAMDDADAALIAAAEAQDFNLGNRPVQPRPRRPQPKKPAQPTHRPVQQPTQEEKREAAPIVTDNVDNTDKNQPVVDTPETNIDPFAGGIGAPVFEDDIPSGGAIIGEEPTTKPTTTESKVEETKSELEKAEEEFNEKSKNFVNVLRKYRNLGFAYNPEEEFKKQVELFSAFLELANSAFKLGKYKFKELALKIYEDLDRNRTELEEFFDNIKGAYDSAYHTFPEEVRKKMTTPAEVMSITVDDLFQTPLPELTPEQKESVVDAGITKKPKEELPKDAITDEQLNNFSEDSELGILNTFHYRPDTTVGETIPFENRNVSFSPNSELPEIFNSRPNDLTYEYSVAQFIDYKTNKPRVDWSNPNTYDWARVGIIITDNKTGKTYWVAMRSPKTLRVTRGDVNDLTIKLRRRRFEIISQFVEKDEKGNLKNKLNYNIKLEPTRLLLHNPVDGVLFKTEPITSENLQKVLQLDSDVDNEINNFAYSTGVRSDETLYTVFGENTGFTGTTAGGVYYIIDGKKRLSGRPLPLKLSMRSFNTLPDLCKVLTDIIFSTGFNSTNKFGNTELYYSDIVNLFLNYGEPTTVNKESTISEEAKANLINKQLYIDNKGAFGVLHFGKNKIQLAGLSREQKDREKKSFKEWLLRTGTVPFKVKAKDSEIGVDAKLKDLFNGRIARSVEKANGRLELFDGLVITSEDLNHSLLSWLVKNGMIMSNLNADRYNRPYVIADGMTKSAPTSIPQSPAVPEVVKQEQKETQEQQKPADRKRRTFRNLDTLGGSDAEVRVNFTPNKAYTTEEKMNKTEARKFLEEKLGMTANEIEIIDVTLSSGMPATAMSHMTKDAIVLYTSDPFGVEYHEAYHRVSLLLMSEQERQKVYSEYRRTHKDMENASDKVVEEALAEDFRNFMTKRVPSKSYKITKWFDKLVDFIKSMFGITTPNSIFRGIYEGKYKNVPVSEEAKSRFEAAYSNRVNFTQVGHEFKHIKALDNYYQAVEFFTISYINKSFEEQGIVDDLTKVQIDFEDMRLLLDDLSYDEEATPEQRAAVKELYDNFDVFKKDVQSQLSALNLKAVQEEDEYDETEERDGGEIEKENFDKYDKASYEVSVVHNLRPAVKLFLSSIEDRLNDNGTYVRDYNPETGIPKVTPFMIAWRRIVDKLYDVDTYQELISESAKLAKTDPFFASVYNKLTKIKDENFRTEILQTITGFRHNFLTVGFSDIGEEGNVSYIANLGGSVNLRNGKRIVNDWNRNFYNSSMITVDENGNRTPNKKALKEVQDRLVKLSNTLAKMNDSTTNEEINSILENFVLLFNEVGIDINFDTLYQTIVNKAFSGNSVNPNSILNAAKTLLANKGADSIYTSLFNTLKEPVKNTGRIKKTIESVFSSENALLNLAITHYQLNSNNLEEKVLGPKNTTVYPLSKHNYITLEFKKLNNDRAYVKDLLRVPINESSLVYNTLANNENVSLTVGTLLNITEYGSGGTGVDYQSAPRIETFIAKLVSSENDILLLPTMSDKKTYMPIQGIKLFKNRLLNLEQQEDGAVFHSISDDVLDQFYRYYLSEYKAILQYRLLKANEDKIEDKNKPTAYIKKGNGGKFRIARGVMRYENGKYTNINFNSMSDEELMNYFSKNNEAQVKADIGNTLYYFIEKQLAYVEKLGLIENKNGYYKNKYLPTSFISEREEKFGSSFASLAGSTNKVYRENLAVFDVIGTFTINHFVSMFEAEKVIYKDKAFYKSYPDVSKRLAGTLSTGTRPRTEFSDPNHIFNRIPRYKQGRYNVAGLKDIELRTNQPKELYKAIYNAYVREIMESSGEFTPEYINDVFTSEDLFDDERIPENIRKEAKQSTERDLSLYGKVTRNEEGEIVVDESVTPINQADASVYCSPTMYKALLAAHGELTPEVEEAIDFIEAYGDDPSLGDIRKYVKTLAAAMSPKKMIYFGHELLQSIPGQYIDMPIFNKMAVFPLFKVLTTGDLRKVYDRMVDEKNPIDMFTTHSAVKVGDIVEYDFYTDASQNEISEFFTKDENGEYKKPISVRQQSFENLLNQMPIEAHDAEKRMLVTQAMKTVYSNLRLGGEYTLPSGRKLTGEELKNLAMSAIDELSDRGLQRILKKLHAERGEDGKYHFKDLEGLSDSLVKDMLSTGADTDIIEQISLNENGKFNVPLSASSVAKQLVSKLISKVNKETVDINLPGGTFIQMSSFGLKSIEKLSETEAAKEGYGRYSINGGERLKLKRDDNSMECVISINLLKHIIPGYGNMSFAEARQWLIDNRIIGENASPSSMAYRVPTQGMSSIAALHIKDVVMSQAGDIIILPDEFTARTGSDFDIDKLFLTRYNYTSRKSKELGKSVSKEEVNKALEGFDDWLDETLAIRDGEIVTRRGSMKQSEAINSYLESKNSDIRYDVTDGTYKKFKYVAVKTEYDFNKSMQENSQGAIENLLIDTFMASLLDSKNFHDTTRPLDVPVNIMKNGIVKVYFAEETVNEPLLEYTEEYQDMLKQDFADSKSGIGPFALNTPHHVLGQLVQLEMVPPKNLSHFKNLHKVTGVDGIHILDWLSALISAHVDVAKDNYIIKLNVNGFTYNMVNLCLRAGAGKNTMFFVSQEIIKNLAESYIQSKGTYAVDKSKSFYNRYQEKEKQIVEEFTKKARSLARNKEEREFVDNVNKMEITDSMLFESVKPGEIGRLETLLNKAKNKDKDYDYYVGQLMVYKLFKELDPLSKALSDLVKASQIDTKKFGKNAIEMNNFLDKVSSVYRNPYFTEDMVKKFFRETFLQRKLENSIDFTLDLLGNVSIQSKKEYYDIFRSFINSAGLSSTSDKNLTTTVTNAIDAYWRSIALYPDSNSELISSLQDIRNMFFGANTMAKRLNRLKKDIINDASNGGNKYPIITVTNGRISNLFLNSITGVTDSTNKSMDYIRLDYSDSVSSNVSRQIREYWKELLDSDIPELRDFARDLVKYAVFSGHGSKHLNALFDFIPQQALEELEYYDMVRTMEDGSNSIYDMLTEDDVDEIFRNNWQDNTLVPILNVSNKNVYQHRETFNGKQKVIAIKGTNRRPICTDMYDKPLYHPYVKVRNKNSTGGYDLYKLIGVYEKQVKDKFEYKPLYILVNKKGLRESGKGVITEYMSASVFGSKLKSRYSVVPGNNVAPTFNTYGGNFLEDCQEVLDNYIIPRVNAQSKKNDAPGLSGTFIPVNTIRYMFRMDMNISNNIYKILTEMDENGDVVLNTEGLAENVNEFNSQQDLFTQEQSSVETTDNNIISSNETNELNELGKQRKNDCNK